MCCSKLMMFIILSMMVTSVFAKRIEITIDNVYSPTYSELMVIAHRDCYPEPICYKPYADQIWFDVNLDGSTLKMNLKNGKTFVFDSFDMDSRAEEINFLKAGSYNIPNQPFNLCCKYRMFPGCGTIKLTWDVHERIFENDSSSFYSRMKEEFNHWVSEYRIAMAENDKKRMEDLRPLIIEVLKDIKDAEKQNGVKKPTTAPKDLDPILY